MPHPARLLPRILVVVAALCATTFSSAATSPALLDEAECSQLGTKLAELFNAGNQAEVVQLLDTFALLDRITPGLGYSEAEERDFRAGVLKTLPRSLGRQFENFTSARFVRLQTVGQERRALLRLVGNGGAVNYMAFVCTRRGNAAVRWCDAFVYQAGESISESTRRTILPLVAQTKKGVLDRLTTTESDYVRHFKNLHDATQQMNAGEFAKAWAECEKLPPAVQRDRTVLLLRLRIAQGMGDEKYLKVIQEWERAFPGDATLDFISIDGDIIRKEYTSAIHHIDSFGQRIGGDAYLDFIAANCYLLAEKHEEARTRARAALRAEPKLAAAYDSLLAVSLKTKAPAETIAVLDELAAVFPGIKLDGIIADESYADFRASAEFRGWQEKRKPVAKPD